MAANYVSSIAVSASPASINAFLAEVARELMSREKWHLQGQTPNSVKFKVGINLFSWGEIVTMAVEENLVAVRSECRFPLQFIDWGEKSQECRIGRGFIEEAV